MSVRVGQQLRLSTTRVRPRIWPQNGKSLHHEPQASQPTTRTQMAGQTRHFSSADAAACLLEKSNWLVTNAHDLTGAPWFISIPLVAFLVSAAVKTPLTLYSHNLVRRKLQFTPLIQAHTAMTALRLRRKAVPNLREAVAIAMRKRTKEILSVFTLSETGSLLGGILTLPIFVSNLEVIRRMCGGPRGILGRFMFNSSNVGDAPEANATSAAEALSASTSAAGIPSSTGLTGTAPAAHDILESITLEPSFATGGCLWFPNLLETDPYHILPFALSAVLILHTIPGTSAARRELFGLAPVAGNKNAALLGQSPARRAFQRTMLVLAIAVGPLTMDLPAALHLYWLSSAGFSLAVSKGIKKALPLPKNSIKPCHGLEIPVLRPKPPRSGV